ncbi:MAG TPA: hypothetical protein VGB60_06995 [Brevundimonas sp.]|uniref:EF-hand domain-containing protein n=1 Tax=Brevundimonas sp. TaxID=1871086 RepID=UPI002EDB87B1
MFRSVLLAALVSAAVGASTASAQTTAVPSAGPGSRPGAGMAPPTERAQVAAWADRLFTRLDVDQNAALTSGELLVLTQGGAAAMGGGRLRAAIAQSDASGDSRISREEMAAGAARLFTRMDANGDGRLTGDELPRPPAPPRAPSMPSTPAPDPFPPMPEGD